MSVQIRERAVHLEYTRDDVASHQKEENQGGNSHLELERGLRWHGSGLSGDLRSNLVAMIMPVAQRVVELRESQVREHARQFLSAQTILLNIRREHPYGDPRPGDDGRTTANLRVFHNVGMFRTQSGHCASLPSELSLISTLYRSDPVTLPIRGSAGLLTHPLETTV